MVETRPYDAGDREGLWQLKRAFELELGGQDPDKRAAYEGKLTEAYRERYLEWVERCVADDPRCVTVAVPAATGDRDPGPADPDLLGYAFLLPQRLAMIWDAAVLNEIYVREAARGTGVADELMAAAVDLARDQSLPLDRLVLDVDRENERAVAFYDRHGFEHWGEMVAREL